MSEAYEQSLVPDESSAYERFAAATVGFAFLAFLAAMAALFAQISVSGSIMGVPTATYFGGGLVALGLAVGGLGVASSLAAFDTDPSASPGLAVGLVFGFVWFVTAGLVATYTLGLGTLGWPLGVLVGLAVGFGTILVPEETGSSLPVAAFLLFVGATTLTGLIGPGWSWTPAAFGATFPGTFVVPFLTVVCTLLVGWTGAKAHAGFGTRGRQNGVFLLISLVVFIVLAVLVILIAYITVRGVEAVFENLSLGSGTVLLAAGVTTGLLATRVRDGIRFGTGTEAVSSFLKLAVTCCLALLTLVPVYAIVTGGAISYWGVTLRPSATIGTMPGLVFGGLTLVVLRRATDRWTPATETADRVRTVLRAASAALGLGLFVEFAAGIDLAVGGVSIVAVAAIVVGVVAALATVAAVVAGRTGGERSALLPPPKLGAAVFLWAFLAACLHVAITGTAVGTAAVGIVDGGTINWPFVMNPSQGLGIQQGVMPAILGTVWIVAGAIVFAVPLAVGAAVYLTEYASDSAFTKIVDIATNGLWSTPSIVFGLFGLAFLIPRFGNSQSIFAAQLVLAFMLLPLVLITSRESLKTVPDEYRDASAALGVSKWQTIRSVVVPAAMPGVITGVILGVGRIAGETAPLLLVLKGPVLPGVSPQVLSNFEFSLIFQPPFVHVTNPALMQKASALPYQLYAVITAGVGADSEFGWGTALVLLGVVLSFYAIGIVSRRYFRSKLEQ